MSRLASTKKALEMRGRGLNMRQCIEAFSAGYADIHRQDLQLLRNGAIGHRSRSIVTLEIGERVAQGWLASWTSSRGELLEAAGARHSHSPQ
ncbi:MAG TPA: hypothetical protein VGM81_04260 [Burkholderiaceae bacterium]|jgi:hypothetical protein